jgi:hypothetical protein
MVEATKATLLGEVVPPRALVPTDRIVTTKTEVAHPVVEGTAAAEAGEDIMPISTQTMETMIKPPRKAIWVLTIVMIPGLKIHFIRTDMVAELQLLNMECQLVLQPISNRTLGTLKVRLDN